MCFMQMRAQRFEGDQFRLNPALLMSRHIAHFFMNMCKRYASLNFILYFPHHPAVSLTGNEVDVTP